MLTDRTGDEDYAADFARGLLDPHRASPRGLKVGGARYDVYRNNVTVSLINALADIYPAVKRITGDAFFRAMARAYVRSAPPSGPLLHEYGRSFPGFVAAYEHAAETPWLPDVARIERAWLDAYHAADAPTLRRDALAQIPHGALATVRFVAHPAARIVRSAFPALTVFVANRGDEPVGPIAARGGEDVLITRPNLDVVVRRLPPGGATFVSALAAGTPLADAAGAGFVAACDFDLAANLAGVIEAGAFSTLR